MTSNPMGGWQTCQIHDTPFRDADGCPVCNGQVAAGRKEAIAAHVAAHPAAAWPWRLPIIRHIRAQAVNYRLNAHYDMWAQMGMLPVNADFDYAIRDAIWRGEK